MGPILGHNDVDRQAKKERKERLRRDKMGSTLAAMKEHVLRANPLLDTKLEKADILEAAVGHMQKMAADLGVLTSAEKVLDSNPTYRHHLHEGMMAGAVAVMDALNATTMHPDLAVDQMLRAWLAAQMQQQLMSVYNDRMRIDPATTVAAVKTENADDSGLASSPPVTPPNDALSGLDAAPSSS